MIQKKKVRIASLGLGSASESGRVGYGGVGRNILVVSEPRFRRFYKMIFEIVCDMHCICN